MKKLLVLILAIAALTALWWRADDAAPSAADSAPSGSRTIDFVPLDATAPEAPPTGATRPAPSAGRSTVRGRCVGPRGEALAGVEIECIYPPGRTLSEADGRFVLTLEHPPAPSNVALLRARAAGLGVHEHVLSVAPGAELELDTWRLAPGVRLRGRVRDGAGAPLAGLEVRCTRAEFAGQGASTTPRGPTLCSTVSGPDGEFELVDAPAGALCVWAGYHGATLWVSTPPLEARAGAQIDGLELVPPRVARDTLLGVRVLDPDGRPLPGARIDYRFHDRSSAATGRGECDESGLWTHESSSRAPHHVIASDPQGRFQAVRLSNVALGVLDAPLQLAPARHVQLEVLDAGGAPLERFALRLFESLDEQLAPGVPVEPLVLLDEPSAPRPNGRVTLAVPAFPFVLQLEAEGLYGNLAGPFDPERLEDPLVVVLRGPPGISGTLTRDGAPLPNATVSLHAALDPQASGARYGAALARSSSDAAGRYTLECAQDGAYWVRVEAPQCATLDRGPLQLRARDGLAGVDFALSAGGAIAGSAAPGHGKRAEGVTIVARRGDGHDRSTTTDERGAFVFEALAPGPWIVERRASADEIAAGWAPELAVLCEVAEGGTTQIALPAPDAGLARLEGQFLLGASAASGWTVEVEGRRATCDAEGRFTLASLPSGMRRITLEAPPASHGGLRLEGEVELRSGANDWFFAPATGRVQGRQRGGAAGDVLRWSWRGDGAWRAEGWSKLDANAGFEIATAPAGLLHFGPRAAAGAGAAAPIQVDPTTTVDVELEPR